jgi:hypothetical protein
MQLGENKKSKSIGKDLPPILQIRNGYHKNLGLFKVVCWWRYFRFRNCEVAFDTA